MAKTDKFSRAWPDIFRVSESLMSMDARSWARHANPLSVYSRIFIGTAVFFALWSPYWIGWWSALAIAAAAIWIWINPRLFEPPEKTTSWATRGVLGERVFLNRRQVAIPTEHRNIAIVATAISVCFLALAVLAFIQKNFWAAFAAWHGATIAKIWFVDRMAMLWDEMKGATTEYQCWNCADWTCEALRDEDSTSD